MITLVLFAIGDSIDVVVDMITEVIVPYIRDIIFPAIVGAFNQFVGLFR